MLFDRTLQAAMGLLDGVEKWAIWRQHDHVESIFQLRWNNNVEMCRAPSKMMKTS